MKLVRRRFEPGFLSPTDIMPVVEAALGVVAEAWRQLIAANKLTSRHRRCENLTSAELRYQMRLVESNRNPRLPPMKIRGEVETFGRRRVVRPSGRVDIEIIHSLSNENDLHIECKIVSNSQEDRPSGRATYYVDHGLFRFVAGRYASGLPWGILLAYVVDGETLGAIERVGRRVAARRGRLRTIRDWARDHRFQGHEFLFSTQHRSGKDRQIDVLHLFLPFRPRQSL